MPDEADDGRLHLDDLERRAALHQRVGAVDAAAIKAFAARVRPAALPPRRGGGEAACSAASPPAAGTPRPSPCGCWSRAARRSPAASIGAGGEIAWPRPTRPGDVLRWRARCWRSPVRSRPDRGTVILRSETPTSAARPVQILTSRLVIPRRVAG